MIKDLVIGSLICCNLIGLISGYTCTKYMLILVLVSHSVAI